MKQSQKTLSILLASIAALIVLAMGSTRGVLSKTNSHEFTGDEKISIAEDLSNFNAVNASGAWQVEITQSDSWSVEIFKPDNYQNRVAVYLDDNVLVLEERSSSSWWSGSNNSSGLVAKVQMPDLTSLDLSGAAEVNIAQFTGDILDINAAGAVELTAKSGSYKELLIDSAGASEIDLKNISTTQAKINSVGASEVVVTMSGGELTGSIIGAGSVDYYGNVSNESITIIGAGDITKKD